MNEAQAKASPPDLDAATLGVKLEQMFRERRIPPLIPGSRLASLINEVLDEGWTYRDYFHAYDTPNLRKFVRQYVPPAVVSLTEERQGTDFLYAIPQKASAVELAHEGKLWKSFVAVSPFAHLVYNRETGSVSVLSISLPVPDNCAPVPPVSLKEHYDLCIQFCAKIESEGAKADADALRAAVGTADEVLYTAWLKACRARKPLDRAWGQFRHERLLALYEVRLLHAGATPARVVQLRQELALDHEVARAPKQVAEATVATEAIGGANVARDDREKRAREMLKAAADRLTYEQLMTVQLPLGAVLDLTSFPPHEK